MRIWTAFLCWWYADFGPKEAEVLAHLPWRARNRKLTELIRDRHQKGIRVGFRGFGRTEPKLNPRQKVSLRDLEEGLKALEVMNAKAAEAHEQAKELADRLRVEPPGPERNQLNRQFKKANEAFKRASKAALATDQKLEAKAAVFSAQQVFQQPDESDEPIR